MVTKWAGRKGRMGLICSQTRTAHLGLFLVREPLVSNETRPRKMDFRSRIPILEREFSKILFFFFFDLKNING